VIRARRNKVTGVTASVSLSTERACISAPATVCALDLVGVIQGVRSAGCVGRLGRWPKMPGAFGRVRASEEYALGNERMR